MKLRYRGKLTRQRARQFPGSGTAQEATRKKMGLHSPPGYFLQSLALKEDIRVQEKTTSNIGFRRSIADEPFKDFRGSGEGSGDGTFYLK
jgi:hypothetical protein